MSPLAHIVTDDNEDRGQGGQRDPFCQRGKKEKQECEGEGMDDAGDGSFCAGFNNIGGGACYGAGGGNAAKNGGADVGPPTSSMLERCFPPIMPSATVAERRDSMAASMAIVKAGEMRRVRSAASKEGKAGFGRKRGRSPKRVPTVSTSRCRIQAAKAAMIKPRIIEGQRGKNFPIARMTARVRNPMPAVEGSRVWKWVK